MTFLITLPQLLSQLKPSKLLTKHIHLMYTQYMIRTQIYLDEEVHRDLTVLAKEEQESMAKLARDILKEGVYKRKGLDKSGKGVLKSLLSIKATGGPEDLSKNLDHYLYGDSKT